MAVVQAVNSVANELADDKRTAAMKTDGRNVVKELQEDAKLSRRRDW